MLESKLDIMSTGWLNLVFAGRNQAYGAYELRRENARTTNRALMIAIAIFLVALGTPTIANIIRGIIPKADPLTRTVVTVIPPAPSIEHVTPPPPVHENPRPHDDMIQSFPPVVSRDDLAHKDPPTDKELEVATPGPETEKGDKSMPIIDDNPGKSNVVSAVTEENSDKPFVAVEVEPTPIGGIDNYYKFLGKKINYPAPAKEAGTQGNVILTFVVERDGSLTEIKALRDPGNGLAEEAIRVLKLAPHWTPGIQNGKKVRVQYTIPISFTLGEQ